MPDLSNSVRRGQSGPVAAENGHRIPILLLFHGPYSNLGIRLVRGRQARIPLTQVLTYPHMYTATVISSAK